ncbi:MAG: tRNA-dihydrouridine synthase family protein [Deltaproteobacteria bacterium]|nr:tRNA-dihydrouridine synthase family protein [Deltaproteobacteria bacterium]
MANESSKEYSWQQIPRPIVCLAPMDGITDSAFRRVVRGFSPRVVLFSEFTSADGFLRSERLRQRLEFSPDEHPYFVQLFGNNPQAFREASLALAQQGVAGVDINMGCPSRRIVHSQHGSGLMRDVQQACRVVEAVASTGVVQVSVKTRLGWSNADGLGDFAGSLADAGASLITIHGRTYNQGYSGRADWEPIHALKKRLSVPVLGNGDVQHLDDGQARMGNLDGFMIGRAAIGNPWVFLPGEQRRPSMEERARVIEKHYRLLCELRPHGKALLEFRKHLVGYLKGFEMAKTARVRMLRPRASGSFWTWCATCPP